MRGIDRKEKALRSVTHELDNVSLDGDSLTAAMDALRSVARADVAGLYSLVPRGSGDDLALDRSIWLGMPIANPTEEFDAFLRGRGTSWNIFNPIRPEPSQRNVVLDAGQVRSRYGVSPVETHLFPRCGLMGCDSIRVLACDGPSLLGWVGFFQEAGTTPDQRRILRALLPSFRRRLTFEQRISTAALTAGALDAALEAIPSPAYVLAQSGAIAHANSAGRAQLDQGRAGLRASLTESTRREQRDGRRVTSLCEGGMLRGHLIVDRADTSVPGRGAAIAQQLRLTRRETQVFVLLLRGRSNANIAAELGAAPRTVETHVTSILAKADVPSRAALIATCHAIATRSQ